MERSSCRGMDVSHMERSSCLGVDVSHMGRSSCGVDVSHMERSSCRGVDVSHMERSSCRGVEKPTSEYSWEWAARRRRGDLRGQAGSVHSGVWQRSQRGPGSVHSAGVAAFTARAWQRSQRGAWQWPGKVAQRGAWQWPGSVHSAGHGSGQAVCTARGMAVARQCAQRGA